MPLSQHLADAFKAACMAEIEALKPGNVHIFADGHGMTVQDFILSAEAVAEVITRPGLRLGERIFLSVQATHAAVKTNTNLGIILLCAPILQAAQHAPQHLSATSFSAYLEKALAETTIEDAEYTFSAIRLANPAGLGDSTRHDVHQPPTCTLLQAMQEAADRDIIAQQYVNVYAGILKDGLPCYRQALKRWQRPAWATTAVYLAYMAHYPDSHIVRKYGETIAKLVQAEAADHAAAFMQLYNPKIYQAPLLKFDSDLKKRQLNPGTSADLTVATLLLHALMPL